MPKQFCFLKIIKRQITERKGGVEREREREREREKRERERMVQRGSWEGREKGQKEIESKNEKKR